VKDFNDGPSVVAQSNAFSPAAAWYFSFFCISFFRSASEKNEIQLKREVPLRITTLGIA
jgi:hypothetical protein